MVSSSYPKLPRNKKKGKKWTIFWSQGTVIKCSTSLAMVHCTWRGSFTRWSNFVPITIGKARLQRSLKQNYVQYSIKQHKEIQYHHQLIRYTARQLARTWYWCYCYYWLLPLVYYAERPKTSHSSRIKNRCLSSLQNLSKKHHLHIKYNKRIWC
jgi:hypothetical protein